MVFEHQGDYIRPLGYYDNPGTKLLVTFAELNKLVGLTTTAAILNALSATASGSSVLIDCGGFTDVDTYVHIDCGAF